MTYVNRLIISIILLCIAAYFFFFSLTIFLDLHFIGFEGVYENNRFTVTRILPGSPSQVAGLQKDDVITAQNGKKVSEWLDLFSKDLGLYLAQRSIWHNNLVDHLVLRGGQEISIPIQIRNLSEGELVWIYFVRFGLAAFLAGLALFIVFSKIENQPGFLASLSFSFLVLWLLSGIRYWRSFLSPYIPDVTLYRFIIMESVFIVATYLVLSTFLHFSMIFPEEREFIRRHRWLLFLVYLFTPVVIGIFLFFATGTFSERLTELYGFRLTIFSIYLVLSIFMLLSSYFTCRSPLQRERSRLLVVSLIIAVLPYLLLWNIPRLIIGRPLIANFDWLLLPLILVPVAITVSINQHHLFGIQGIARRRLRILEDHLQSEKENAFNLDRKIHQLKDEICQLESELQQYTKIEFPSETSPESDRESLRKLEEKRPIIKAIREERLIGMSPLWKKIFEQIILASTGDSPVLITGESGTGKTDVAWAIHILSERKEMRFKAISCSQFEHSDPAFALGKIFGIGKGHGLPNVHKDGQHGLLDECDGGTLFLDDIDRLPLNVQDLLLYPLEGKPFEPGIGSGPPKQVSVKFIFATNQDLKNLASQGYFRKDVLSRIVSSVYIPPLRERPEDIHPLVDHFRAMASRDLKHEVSVITPKAMNLLLAYSYASGNVRELRAELYKAIGKAMLEEDNILRSGYLSERFLSADRAQTDDRDMQAIAAPVDSFHTDLDESRELTILRKHHFRIKPSEKELGYSHKSRTLSNHFRGICIKMLRENSWDFDKAARTLVGEDDTVLIMKVKGKIVRFFNSIEDSVRSGCERKLFNNLPAQYHSSFDAAISFIRSRLSSAQE